MRIFVSYHTPDHGLAVRLTNALAEKEPTFKPLVAPQSLQIGKIWLPQLEELIQESDAFLLLLGESGIGEWQKTEYYAAFEKLHKNIQYTIVPILAATKVSGLAFLRQIQWIETNTPYEEPYLSKIISALKGHDQTIDTKLWQTINPYRGLEALQEEDSELFFGRDGKIAELLSLISSKNNRLIMLIGNSGVGKSSLMYAG
jgi:ribosome biogenesis GTPase A